MEGKKRRFPWRAARWERMLLTAVATVLSGEVFFNLGNDNFRISGAVVLFPVLLLTLLQDEPHPPDRGPDRSVPPAGALRHRYCGRGRSLDAGHPAQLPGGNFLSLL